MELAFDLLLAAALLWSAWRALTVSDATHAVVQFMVFGMLLALVWARLLAPDIALAEVAIGTGLTGALLLDTLGGVRQADQQAGRPGSRLGKVAVISGAGALTVLLGGIMLGLPAPALRLPLLVAAQLKHSGVAHPVTAVLLNFRGYDTLLEVAVLLLASLGVQAVAARAKPQEAGRAADLVLRTLTSLVVPLMVMVAIYLFWAGSHLPGGAFQAAAVLAAAAVLLHLVGLCSAWRSAKPWLRLGLAGGFLVFLAVAAPVPGGELLQYRPARAGALIMLIEAGLTVSLGLILAGLFLFLSDREVG